MSSSRVQHEPIDYEGTPLAEAIALMVVLHKVNPEMLEEILCRIAMGVGGFKTRLTTTPGASKRITDLETQMKSALIERSQSHE